MKMPGNKGILLVISGFSGAGKGTVVEKLLKQYDNYALSVSVTTRDPRPGEEEGREYYFRTREEFRRLIEENMLIEYAEYVNNYYGTPKKFVEEQLALGKDVVLEIEMQGARQVKKQFPGAVLVFVTPPDFDELKERLTKRGTETPEVIESRLKRAAAEADAMEAYDYIALNERDLADECTAHIHEIVRSERSRLSNYRELVADIQKDAVKYI